MQAAIGYLRVNTREQGRSGWGLAAQRLILKLLQRAKVSRSDVGTKTYRPGPERTRYCCAQDLRQHSRRQEQRAAC